MYTKLKIARKSLEILKRAINLETKEMISLTDKQRESYTNHEICHIFNKSLKRNMLMIKNIVK